MHLLQRFLLTCFFALTTSWVTTAVGQSTDAVRVISSGGGTTSIRGTVIRMNKRNVTLESSGAERRVEANEIRFITYASEPRELRNARTEFFEDRYNRTYELLSTYDLSGIQAEFVRYEAQFLLASAAFKMAVGGEGVPLSDAQRLLDELLADEAFGQNYNYYQALRIRAELGFAQGEYESAESLFAELKGLAWPRVSMEATLRLADCQLRLEKFQEAGANYQAVSSSELNDEAAQQAKLFARIGQANAMAGNGQASDSITILETLIERESNTDRLLFARIYTALGRCYLLTGNDRYAKHEFLKVHLLFKVDPDCHAEALYHLIDLWGKENNVSNSNECREILRRSYPNSVWAKRT